MNAAISPDPRVRVVIPWNAPCPLHCLADVLRHNRWGHPSFFLGEISQSGGWKSYYPVLILLKWPVVVLALSAGVLILSFRRRISLPPDFRILLLFPGAFLLM